MTPVTIGMPACDSARTLDRAIRSVLAQTDGNWRLVISDDASTDRTATLAEDAARADPRIRVIRQPVRLGAMNFGVLLALADTPLFAWLAADDWWHPRFLEATRSVLDTRPDAVSALPRVAWAAGDGPAGKAPPTAALEGGWDDRARAFLADPGGSRIYGLMRTDAARASFPPEDVHAWDWAFMLGLLAQGPQVALPEVLLTREETDWLHYADAVDASGARGLARSFPAWPASRLAITRGHVPAGALRALWALNLLKHEERLAACDPARYARRHRLYRVLGMHFASDPRATAALMDRVARRNARRDPARAAAAAALRDRARAAAAPALRTRRALPPLTAVLAARNAAATLDRLLAHYQRHDARVILIDHGSTDRTRAIAEARRGAPVVDILDQPFDGTFDLAAQLDLKRQVLAGLGDGWVIHADADEFPDPPADKAAQGSTLRALAAGWDDGVLAAPCRELAFLPRTEDELHSPDGFEATLRHAVPIADHDPKQRLFRAGADLTLWRATGGHTVTADPARIAPDRLVLRHYPGLSLDHLRAQYLSRVHARADLARRWHTTRAAAQSFDIVPPRPGTLAGPDDPEAPTLPNFPVFVPRPAPPDPATPDGPADLWIVAGDPAATDVARALLAANFAGLRTVVSGVAPQAPAAVLHVLRHPSCAAGRDAACAWVRGIARVRQSALTPGLRYAEVRAEDLPAQAGALVVAVRALLSGSAPGGTSGFLRPTVPVTRPSPDPATRAICSDLARDLGYGWTDDAPA
jgi:glycosyltransferase involved in cell wall biosynthesis